MASLKKVTIHLIYKNPEGPIRSLGMQGTPSHGNEVRYAVACNPMARLPKYATGEARATTCKECMKTDAFKMVEKTQSPAGDALEMADAADFPTDTDVNPVLKADRQIDTESEDSEE